MIFSNVIHDVVSKCFDVTAIGDAPRPEIGCCAIANDWYVRSRTYVDDCRKLVSVALRGNGIAMVLQDPRYALNPVKNVAAQLEEALTLHQSLSRKERAERVREMIHAVGLNDAVLARYPGELSGGMGQRIMIAIALMNNPQVLIADEPTSALDARLRNQILELLVQQCEQRQMAMLLISHDLPLVAEHCDRVLVMYQGEKVDEMAANQLPQATHPYTRTLWTCRPDASTYGQMLPTLDRTQPWEESNNGAR
jgi:peptide/nickel transport system ATP-binding protein